jgi:hypothetical protein
MAKCPNCGQEAARTIDWVCEWCGYPLPDGSFKKTEKTFRELKEERQFGEPAGEEIQAIEEAESEPPRQVKPLPRPQPVREVKPPPKVQPVAEIKPSSAPAPAPIAKPAPQVEPPIEAKPAPPPEVKSETAPAAIEITVSDLLSAYETGGKAADARFANQTLRITGVIDKINVKAALDIYSMTLKGAGKSMLPQGVRCVFDKKDASVLNQLSTGQTVTVQGKYTGSMIDISLRDCLLVR